MTHQNPFTFKEIILYALAAITSLFVLGYSVHMLIGDIVSPTTERWAITVACFIGALVITFMVWDVARLRKRQSAKDE